MVQLSVVEKPEAAEMALTLYKQARSLTINNSDDYAFAGQFLLSLKDQRKEIVAFFRPLKQKQDEAKKAILDREKESLKPLEDAEALVSPAMMRWKREQDRIAEEEARRLQAEARKREEERKLAEALQAEQEGDQEAAEAIIQEPIEAPVIRVQSAAPKISGLTERKTWTYEIENEAEIPRIWLMVDTVKLGAFVRNDKGKTKIPGIKVREVSNMTGARR
ncbi:MAG: hypothetical protein ACHQYP_05925 [Nitrospiria bacterium]